jgi:hypothetical protein
MYLSELGHIFCASGRSITKFPARLQEKKGRFPAGYQPLKGQLKVAGEAPNR